MLLNRYFRLLQGLVITGVMAGVSGIAMHEALLFLQRIFYWTTQEDYLLIIQKSSPTHRFLTIIIVSSLVAICWYVLQKHYTMLSVKKQLTSKELPRFWNQFFHAFLQLIFVAAGGPIGKEGAPRELGALFAGQIGNVVHLEPKIRRLLIACGAAGGLAAVYQVPISSVLFAFETLAIGVSIFNIVSVSIVVIIATVISRPLVTGETMYTVHQIHFTFSFVILLLLGVIVGVLARQFKFLADS